MTKEEMLRLLSAAYTGPGSAGEGTFAGDVLRACADGMAQLWSMDIDGLERRAFVSSAVGDWLTAVCADRGVARREGETDDELRQRALAALAATPASGNADHYAAWCGRVEDILRVKVLPLARGSGTVDIVAVGRNGKAPAKAVIDAAQAIVDGERPVGADARVIAATEPCSSWLRTMSVLLSPVKFTQMPSSLFTTIAPPPTDEACNCSVFPLTPTRSSSAVFGCASRSSTKRNE